MMDNSSPWLGLMALLLCVSAAEAEAEELDYPLSIAVDQSGGLFLADRNLPGVWRLEGDRLSLVFRGAKKFRTPLTAIRCVAVDREGKLLAGDSSTQEVYWFDEAGKPQPLTGQGQTLGRIGIPMDIVVDHEGNLLVSDLELHRIVKVPREGGAVEQFASVAAPRGLFYDAQRRLWVISGRKLLRFSAAGEKETIVDNGVFEFPHTVAVAADGVAYVCDGYAKAIWKVVPGGKPEKWVVGGPFVNPVGIDIWQGRLLVVDPRAKAVFEIDADGNLTRRDAKERGQATFSEK